MSYSEIIFSDLYEKLEKTIANVEKDPFGSIKNEIETHIEDGKEDSYGTHDKLADVVVKKGIQTRILKLERELVEYLTDPKAIFPCDQCVFEASTKNDLSKHKYYMHVKQEEDKGGLWNTTEIITPKGSFWFNWKLNSATSVRESYKLN